MILGFHYHIPAIERKGIIYTSGFLGVFLDSLASNVDELICFMHTPLPDEESLMDYALMNKNIRLVGIGPHVSVPRRLLASQRIIRHVSHALARLDILLIRCPTPLLGAFSSVKTLRKSFLIVGDYQKSARDIHQPFFRKKAIQWWAAYNRMQQDNAIKNALVFVNNGLIYNELKNTVKKLHLIRTTTLNSNDFYFREDTCESEKINLLYTGRLDLSKGLLEMVDALYEIRRNGMDAILHLVGWEEKNSIAVTTELKRRASELDLTNHVLFHGRKKIGDELNYFYRVADIFIIGSKVNEGFPRTIWEAFANSLPVIASAVGSIPLFIDHNVHALLIKPGSSEEMTQAVIGLIKDKGSRKSLIKNAYKLAQANTLEVQTKALVTITQNHIASS